MMIISVKKNKDSIVNDPLFKDNNNNNNIKLNKHAKKKKKKKKKSPI